MIKDLILVILYSFVMISMGFAFRGIYSNFDCPENNIIQQPDYHGNIQGDTLCMPERDSYGYPNNPFR